MIRNMKRHGRFVNFVLICGLIFAFTLTTMAEDNYRIYFTGSLVNGITTDDPVYATFFCNDPNLEPEDFTAGGYEVRCIENLLQGGCRKDRYFVCISM